MDLLDEHARDHDVTETLCALCSIRIPEHSDGYQCEQGCDYKLCQTCGNFLSRVPSLCEETGKALRFISLSQHYITFTPQISSLDSNVLMISVDGRGSSGKTVTLTTVEGEIVSFSLFSEAGMMTIDDTTVFSDFWNVYPDSDGTIYFVGELCLNRRVEIEITPAPSEYDILSQVKQVQSLLLLAMKRTFAKTEANCDLYSQVHKLMWYPKDFRLDVVLLGVGSNDDLRIGLCSDLNKHGLISSLFAYALASQVPLSIGPTEINSVTVSNDILSLYVRSPYCAFCYKFATTSNDKKFKCNECRSDYDAFMPNTCWHCEDCKYVWCNDCWPLEDSQPKKIFQSRLKPQLAYLEGQTFIDSFQSLIWEARDLLSSGELSAWTTPLIRSIRPESSRAHILIKMHLF